MRACVRRERVRVHAHALARRLKVLSGIALGGGGNASSIVFALALPSESITSEAVSVVAGVGSECGAYREKLGLPLVESQTADLG